jgi:hypothetical protein
MNFTANNASDKGNKKNKKHGQRTSWGPQFNDDQFKSFVCLKYIHMTSTVRTHALPFLISRILRQLSNTRKFHHNWKTYEKMHQNQT